ncbi:hypothetical protein BsWGS_00268 [Bradybaena similaris]
MNRLNNYLRREQDTLHHSFLCSSKLLVILLRTATLISIVSVLTWLTISYDVHREIHLHRIILAKSESGKLPNASFAVDMLTNLQQYESFTQRIREASKKRRLDRPFSLG